jgi:UDP-GlcNAc:undecaprenyl-phosphate GlcNAc-1-phosphate transferase
VSCVVTALFIRFILESKWINLPECKPARDRWNNCTVCTCGGVVFLICYWPALFFSQGRGSMLGLGLVASAVWGMGLLDDIEPLPPHRKFVFQVVASVFLMLFGWRLMWLDNVVIDVVLSMFWIVGLTNAFNLMDNMDGLCGGVSLVALVFLAILVPSPIMYALLGIIIGFLIFNFPPARLFMGDCGAYFLGVNLACLSMSNELGKGAMLLLLVPLADTTFVTARRVLKGKSPARGGLDHLSHEIAGRSNGLVAVAILWFVSLVAGVLALTF